MVYSELAGTHVFSAPGGDFTLTAKADRIEHHVDGTVSIIDYKTGVRPRDTAVQSGLSPQLPLEALILREGGFLDLQSMASALAYWELKGGREPGKIHTVKADSLQLAAEAQEGLEALVRLFDDPDTPYLACPDPDKLPSYNDYEHLERVQEWAVG